MALLGPISFHEDGWDWDTGFPAGDWAHFASYTKRVRSFSYDGKLYDEEGLTEDHLSPDVPAKLLYYVAINRGAYLLPQNQKLRWRASTDNDLQMILPFLSPALREVDIEAQWEVSYSGTSRLLRTLHAALPHDITSIRFVPNEQMGDESEEVMSNALNARSCLRALRLPLCPVNASMLIPNLRILEAEFGEAWNADPGAFFLDLSEQCPLIEDLRIIFLSDWMLTVESVRPLLRCSKLRSLDLESPGEVDLRDKDITDMGNAWRDLEAFHISSRRGYISRSMLPTGTPIASLVTFAQAFSPKLRKLAIHINSSSAPLPPNPPRIQAQGKWRMDYKCGLGHAVGEAL
ncbi:hypothetical protein FRC00_002578 [Tulasnella sp. 408]|nr:hypothetical protein FRC00_002578 [Tulasnella sp. 408]